MDHLILILMNLGVSGKNVKKYRETGEQRGLIAALGYGVSTLLCVGALIGKGKRRSHKPKLSEKQERFLNGVVDAMRIFLAI